MNDAVHFQARNESGASLYIDGSPSVGGENKGMRPMETVLAGLAGCSAMDLVSIIKKQRMTLKDCKIDVDAERENGVPSPFTKIHLHYRLYGELDRDKTGRAVDLAVDSYCSVAVMLEKSAEITHSFEIIRE